MQNRVNNWLIGSWIVEDHIIFYNSKPIAVLNPSTIFGTDHNNGKRFVLGPLGVVYAKENNADELWTSLVISGSVLFGSEQEIKNVVNLLKKEESSRTVSYLCCVAKTCFDVIEFNKKINTASIVFLGCGGIGSLTAVLLAGLGIKKMRIVEPDIVELSNLNRQIFFTRKDVGKYKADVINNTIQERFPDVNVEVIKKVIVEETIRDLIKGFQIVFTTADDPINLSSKTHLLAKEEGIISINTGYITGWSKLFVSPDITDERKNIYTERGPFPIMPSFGPTNAELAGLASSVIVHCICGLLPEDKLPLSMSWNNLSFPREEVAFT